MKLLRYSYVLLVFFLFPLFGLAVESSDKTIRVVADHWKDYTNHDGTGVYIETIKQIYEPLGYTIDFHIMPFRRAVSRINLGSADILLAEENMQHLIKSQLYNAEDLLTPQQPIGISLVSAIFKSNSPLSWQEIKNNHNAKIAWIRGYEYRHTLGLPHTNIALVNNSEQGLHLLLSGRIDCFIDDIEDSVIAQNIDDLSNQKFNYKVINRKFLYPVFYNNTRGKTLISNYEEGIDKLIQNKKLLKLHIDKNIPYPFNTDSHISYQPPASSGFTELNR